MFKNNSLWSSWKFYAILAFLWLGIASIDGFVLYRELHDSQSGDVGFSAFLMTGSLVIALGLFILAIINYVSDRHN